MSSSKAADDPFQPENETKTLKIGETRLIYRPDAPSRRGTILNVREGKKGVEAYVSFEGADKRLDTWLSESLIGELDPQPGPSNSTLAGQSKTNGDGTGDHLARAEASPSAPSTPEREHAELTRVRNFEDVRFGEYLIKTWYYSPYPMPIEEKVEAATTTPLSSSSKKRKIDTPNGSSEKTNNTPLHKSRSHGEVFASVGLGGEGARGRLWVCDYCFKYMKTKDGWYRHKAGCNMQTPPGRKVYQRGSYTIWEVDGAQAPLYCQNLSLFGKLFIDHKSVFFHVENFLFYVIADASTSKHDLAMAFFSKLSYDDYNLACIVTFPPCQNRGFGKLLIEFSYYLTKHPSTRSATESPGTPERPLSDLGLKGYTAYWVSAVLRVCRNLLLDGPKVAEEPTTPAKNGGRSMRERRVSNVAAYTTTSIEVEGIEMKRIDDLRYKGQYGISCTLKDLAKAAHLRIDDTAYTLSELGFLRYRRAPPNFSNYSERYRRKARLRAQSPNVEDEEVGEQRGGEVDDHDLGEWKDVEVVITRGMVQEQWDKWRVKDQGVLDESCVLL